jgi:hypothetical protein
VQTEVHRKARTIAHDWHRRIMLGELMPNSGDLRLGSKLGAAAASLELEAAFQRWSELEQARLTTSTVGV